LEITPLKLKVRKSNFDLYKSITSSEFDFTENDVIVISSKYCAMSEGSVLALDKVKTTSKARLMRTSYQIDERLAEIILREADYVFKGVPGFLLSVKDGILAPNAGIDKSNVPRGHVVLYPDRPFETADKLRKQFLVHKGVNVRIVVADSRLMPGRIGTVGIAIACSGFEPVEDLRGSKDLFGKVLRVSLKAVADSIATIGVSAMGESNESTPAIVLRGVIAVPTDRKLSWRDMAIDPEIDLYLRGLRH
jgi:coenzyme F420-0:L-glutamate ligase